MNKYATKALGFLVHSSYVQHCTSCSNKAERKARTDSNRSYNLSDYVSSLSQNVYMKIW